MVHISDCHRKKGSYAEAERFLSAARSLLDEPISPPILGKLEYRDATILLARGETDRALRTAFSAYRRLKDSDEHGEVAGIQTLIGHCYLRLGLLAETEDFFTDALSSFRRVEDRVGIAYAYNNLGLLHKNACRWKRAMASFNKSLDIANTIGLAQHVILVQLNLGVVYAKVRRFADAVSAFDAAASGAERFGDHLNLTKSLLMLGRTFVMNGQLSKAEKALLRGQAMAEELGYSREAALADEYLGELMIARGEHRSALKNLDVALEKARRIAPEGDVVAECLRRIGDAQYRLNQPRAALATIDEGARIAASCEVYELGYYHRTRGLCHARLGDLDAAVEALQESVASFERYGNPYEKALSEQMLARVHVRSAGGADGDGALMKAKAALANSIIGFSKLDDGESQIVSQVLLANVEQRLGNIDDALLAVFEADRLAEEERSGKFRRALASLRNKLENRMSSATTRVLDQFSVLGDIQTGARSRDQLIKGLSSTLRLIVEHLGADAGFVAISPPGGGMAFHVVGREGLDRKAAQAIQAWFSRRGDADAERAGAMVVTDLEKHPDADDLRAALEDPTGTLLVQGLGFEGERLGLLCVHQGRSGRAPMGRDALHFVAAYSSLISLSVYELVRSERRDRETVKPRSQSAKGFQSIVTENKGMVQLLNLAERVAHSDATVLLQGETGTGKGLIAYAIHLLSERREHRFIHVNCAALPEQLLESELFGHVRGSFTGAVADKPGLLHQADGGTVFLDEIGKTSLAMQGKLLQFLDTGKVRKVGSNDLTPVDVRVICASKTNLLGMCEEGRFLEDFFYRINDFPLTVPPLRDRREDISLLMHHYLDKLSRELHKTIRGVNDEFVARLEAYAWPGNVRELEKVVKRAVILADDGDMLGLEHLAPEVAQARVRRSSSGEATTLRERIEELERVEIAESLRLHDGNKSQAAIHLGISYPSLLSKIKRYNIQ